MNKKLLVIVGATASGKSAIALQLAKQFDGEIVAADAWTVRRELTIGTAKPTAIERQAVPHHLIDIIAPDEDFSAAAYKPLALAAIRDIQLRDKLPILVGGTGLYVDAILYDYQFMPSGSPGEREALNRLDLADLLVLAKDKHLPLDAIDNRNKRRVIRLIETNGMRPTRSAAIRPDTLVLGLPVGPDQLRERIAARIDHMFAEGLEQEVRSLRDKYGTACEALKGIGYREWQGYFQGNYDYDQLRQKIITNTLALAKRQQTWFKQNKAIQWIFNGDEVVDIVTTFINE